MFFNKSHPSVPDLNLSPVTVFIFYSADGSKSPADSQSANIQMKSWPLIGRPVERDTTIKHMMETTRHRPPAGPRGRILCRRIRVLVRPDCLIRSALSTRPDPEPPMRQRDSVGVTAGDKMKKSLVRRSCPPPSKFLIQDQTQLRHCGDKVSVRQRRSCLWT